MGLSIEHSPMVVNGTNDPARVLAALSQLRQGCICIPALADRVVCLCFWLELNRWCSVEMIGPTAPHAGRDARPVRPASRVHRCEQKGKKDESKRKRAATDCRRATPVARERNPTTSIAQEGVPCREGIG